MNQTCSACGSHGQGKGDRVLSLLSVTVETKSRFNKIESLRVYMAAF